MGDFSGSVRAPGGAYNCVSTSAFDDHNSAFDDHNSVDPSNHTWWNGNAQGTTTDGRKKPDISAPGVNIRTTTNTNTFADATGASFASFAAPHVAGTAASVISGGITNMLTAKAAILNSVNTPGSWDGQWGWGKINAKKAFDIARDHIFKTWEEQITQGQTVSKFIYPSATEYATITLCWHRHMLNYTTPKVFSNLTLMVYRIKGATETQIFQDVGAKDNAKQAHFEISLNYDKYRVAVSGTKVDTSVSPEAFAVASTHDLESS